MKNHRVVNLNDICSMPNRKSSVIKKSLATIIAVSAILIVLLAGCSGAKESDTSNESTTASVTTEKAAETTAETTVKPTETTKKAAETTVKPTKAAEKATESTSKPTKKETVADTTAENKTTKKQSSQEKYKSDPQYKKLEKVFKKELDKKKFSKNANVLLQGVFDKLWKNYSGWKKLYRDLPEKSDYIKTNLIDVIKDIKKVNFYTESSKEGKELLDDGNASGFTDDDFIITIICESKKPTTDDLERFFHEIIHVKQKAITFNDNYFKGNEDLWELIVEGGATFHMKFVTKFTYESAGGWIVSKSDKSRTIEYRKHDCTGDLVGLNAYEKLIYLAGYKKMENVEKGAKLSTIKEAISQKYGSEKAEKILSTMKKWYKTYSDNWKSDKSYDLSVQLEKEFLEFMKSDILNSKDKKQREENIRLYENYKKKNMPIAYVGEVFTSDSDITNKTFGIDTIDKSIKKA